MKKWWLYTYSQELYQAHKRLNGFFFYLRKIPFIGRKIPETIYQSYDLKSVLFLLYTIFFFPLSFLAKGLWLNIFPLLAMMGSNLLENKDLFAPQHNHLQIGIVMWVVFVAWGVHFLAGFNPGIATEDRDFIQFFALPRTEVLQIKRYSQPLVIALLYGPALAFSSWNAQNPWLFVLGIGSLFASRWTGNVLMRWTYQWKWSKKQLTNFTIFQMCLIILLTLCVLLFRDFITPLTILLLSMTQLLLSVLCLFYLKTFQKNEQLYTYQMEYSLVMEKEVAGVLASNEYTRQGIAMQQKLSLEAQKDLSHLKGMAYLNALLFQRYRPILWKRQRNWLLAFAAAALIGLEIALYQGTFMTEKTLLPLLPLSFMLMYICSMGKAISQMVFVNCDIAMLHYPFYREAKTILEGFRFRFLKTCQYNASLAGAIFLMCQVWGGFRYSLGFNLLLALLLLSLTALFSFHDLFIYYLLQPFTADMEVTNPVYKFLSGLLYWVAYFNTQLGIRGVHYLLLLSIVLLLYVGLGYLLLLKKAPKTFVLK